MIKMRLTGPWRQTCSLLKNYKKRLDFVYSRAAEDLAKACLQKLKDLAPRGEEYDQYVESLEVVKLTGRQDFFASAIVSKRTGVKVSKILANSEARDKTVVYIQSSPGAEGESAAEVMSNNNPWPIDMIPNGLPRNGVILVHRVVTEDEMAWSRQKTFDFIREHKGELSGLGVVFDKVEEPDKSADNMDSLPDYMALGLRSEFGINVSQRSHWRPAVHWARTLRNILDVVNADKDIRAALHDWLFKKHTLSKWSDDPGMDELEFKKECSDFQRKVSIG